MDILEKSSTTLPRIDGDYLVVPYNFELPEISVITGEKHDLEKVTEQVSSGGCLMLLLLGPFGLIFGWKTARISYYLESCLVRQTRTWRIATTCLAVPSLGLMVWSINMQSLLSFLIGLASVIVATFLRRLLGNRIKISNVWEGEIFIRDLPEAVVNEVIEPES